MKSYRYMDVDWSGTVSRYGKECLELGGNPDVEELVRYNHDALVAACTHGRRYAFAISSGVGWICKSCGSPAPAPVPGTGSYSLSNTRWISYEEQETI